MGIQTFSRTLTEGESVPMDPSLQQPGSFSVTTQLMQDAIQAQGVSVGSGRNQEALFANPFKDGREESLVLDVHQQLTYLQRADSSETGWIQSPVAMPEGVKNSFTEVVVAVHLNGEVWAFCVPTAPGGMNPAPPELFILSRTAVNPDGTAQCSWNSALGMRSPLSSMFQLTVSYSADAGPVVMGRSMVGPHYATYAISCVGQPTEYPDAARWNVITGGTFDSQTARLVGAGYQSSPAPNGNYIFYTLDGSTLTRFSYGGNYTPGGPMGWATVSTTVDAFCGTWNVPAIPQAGFSQADVGYMYMDVNGDLVTGYFSPTLGKQEDRASGLDFVVVKDSSGNAVYQPYVWQDIRGFLHIYGVTGTKSAQNAGTLSALHQMDWKVPAGGSFTPVLPAWTSAKMAGDAAGIGGFDLMDPADRLVAFDFNSSGHNDALLAYGPDKIWVLAQSAEVGQTYAPVFEGAPSTDLFPHLLDQVVAYDYNGTGKEDSLLCYWPGQNDVHLYCRGDGATLAWQKQWTNGIGLPMPESVGLVPFDYAGTGNNDHLLYYTLGSPGTAYILKPAPDTPTGFTKVNQAPLTTLAGFALTTGVFITPLDYNSSGSSTHLLCYVPGAGKVYIVTSDKNNGFTAVVANNSGGIGTYDLAVPEDRLLAFDYNNLGFNDHILAYRPGTNPRHGDQTVWVLERTKTATSKVHNPKTAAYKALTPPSNRYGMGGYDFAAPPPLTDLVIGVDYADTGGLSYLVPYRPGAGKMSIFGQQAAGNMVPVYQAPPPTTNTLVTVGIHADVTDFCIDPQPDFWPSELIKMSGMNDAEAYCICTQDVTTSQWQTDKVRLPEPANPDFYVVSHYMADATLLSQQGNPMPNHNVVVAADSLVEVQIGAISYQVGPGRSISLTTNSAGKLVVSTAARGLNPPTVTLNADGLASGVVIDFAAQANAFLAGTGTLPSQTDRFTADLLETATAPPNPTGPPQPGANDDPPLLVDNWPDLKERGLTPQIVIDHCTNMYSKAGTSQNLQMTLEGLDGPQPVHSYVIQLWDPDRPAFQAFANQDELDAYKTYRNNHPSYGGWWDDFTSWASDVWEGVKSGAQKVAEVIVSTVVEIAVWVGDAIVSLGEMIIDAIEQAIQAVEAVFQMIADAITRVIDWLKSLFMFADIWSTKTALETGFKQSLTTMDTGIANLADVADNWFHEQESKVRLAFAELKSQYAGTQVGDIPNKVPDYQTASGGKISQQEMSGSPQGNWMLNQMQTEVANQPERFVLQPHELCAEASDAWDAFYQKWNDLEIGDNLAAVAADLQGILDAAFEPDSQPAQTPLYLVLDAIENLIIALIEAADLIVQALLALVRAIVSEIEPILFAPFTSSVIQGIYHWIQGMLGIPTNEQTDASVGDLLLLIMAFVGTVAWKLTQGVDSVPFPNGFPVVLPTEGSLDATEPDPSSCVVFQYIGNLIATILAPIFGAATDAMYALSPAPIPEHWSWSYGNAFITVFGCVLVGAPWFYDAAEDSKAMAIWVVWCVFSAPCIASLLKGNSFKNTDLFNVGPWATCGFGILLLVFYVLATLGKDSTTVAGAVFAALPLMTQPIRWLARRVPLYLLLVGAGINIVVTVFNAVFNAGTYGIACHFADEALKNQLKLPHMTIEDSPQIGMAVRYDLNPLIKGGNGPVSEWQLGGQLPNNLKLTEEGIIQGYSDPDSVNAQVQVTAFDSYAPPLPSISYNNELAGSFVQIPKPVTGPVSSLEKTSGDIQSAKVGNVFLTQMSVRVLDAEQHAVPDAVVKFVAPAATDAPSGVFVNTADVVFMESEDKTTSIVTSRSDGVAIAPDFMAAVADGPVEVVASVPGVPSAIVTFNLTNQPAEANSMVAVAGNNQKTIPGTSFEPLQVKVLSADNEGVDNCSVTFTVVETKGAGASFPDGSAEAQAVTTGGTASSPILQANSTAGIFTVQASLDVPGVEPITFSLQNVNAAPAVIVKNPASDNQQVREGAQLTNNFSVTVFDAAGNPYPYTTVYFTAPESGASGLFDAAVPSTSVDAVTNSQGIATAPEFTANQTLGDYQVTVSLFETSELTAQFSVQNI
ncbi:hypothetical protein [Streptomyces sp. NPDC001139]